MISLITNAVMNQLSKTTRIWIQCPTTVSVNNLQNIQYWNWTNFHRLEPWADEIDPPPESNRLTYTQNGFSSRGKTESRINQPENPGWIPFRFARGTKNAAPTRQGVAAECRVIIHPDDCREKERTSRWGTRHCVFADMDNIGGKSVEKLGCYIHQCCMRTNILTK